VVRDVYPRDQAAKVLSYMASAMALMPAVAPIFGGVMESTVGWQGNFVLLAVFGAVLLAGTWRLLGETNHHPDPHALEPWRVFGNYGHLLRDRRFMARVLTVAFGFAALFCFISGSSFVLIDVLRVDARLFGFAFGCVVFGYVSGTFLSGRIGQRIGLERMIRFGILLGIAAGVLLALFAWVGVQTVPAVVGPASLYFLSVGLVLPNTTAAAIAPYPTMAGTASAMLGFVQMAVGAVAGWLVGVLHNGTTLPMASVMAAMAVAAALAHAWGPRDAAAR
jgi:DHA1 family bicyclomycin/chloramphenicol resistance-like MFS transporter